MIARVASSGLSAQLLASAVHNKIDSIINTLQIKVKKKKIITSLNDQLVLADR